MRRRPCAAIALALLLTSCGGPDRAPDTRVKGAREAVGGVDVPAAAPVAAANTAPRLPEDFPADVVLPPNHIVVSVVAMGPSRSVVLRSPGTLTALYDDFRAGQANQGWTETVAMQGVGDAMLGFRKGDRTVVANFRPDREGHVLVSLSLQPQAAVSAR